MLGHLSICWYSCRVISMKQVFGSMVSLQLKAYIMVLVLLVVCAAQYHNKSVHEMSLQRMSMLVAYGSHSPHCNNLDTQIL